MDDKSEYSHQNPQTKELSPYPLIHEKISAIMAEMAVVPKDSKNESQGWNFRSNDQIKNAANPLFRKYQVYYTPEVIERIMAEEESRSGTKMKHFQLRVKYKIYTIDGSYVEATVWGEAADSGDKGLGKAQTYAEKVMLLQVLNIPTEEQAKEDPDYETHEFKKGASTSDPEPASEYIFDFGAYGPYNFKLKQKQTPLRFEDLNAVTLAKYIEGLKHPTYEVKPETQEKMSRCIAAYESYAKKSDPKDEPEVMGGDELIGGWDELGKR